jgi:hypothetical protein
LGWGFGWVVEGAEGCKAGFWEGCVWAEGFVYLRGLLVYVMWRGCGIAYWYTGWAGDAYYRNGCSTGCGGEGVDCGVRI